MNLLDENIRRDQRELLARWSIRFLEIGNEIGRLGVDDEEIVRLLHGLKSVTFFTLDSDFYKAHLCHQRYCLVYLDIEDHEAAASFATHCSTRWQNARVQLLESPIHD